MTKRVVHVITGLGVGGAERALFNLLNASMPEERAHVRVVSITSTGVYGPAIEALGVAVEVLGLGRKPATWGGLRKLWVMLRRDAPDVIVSWMYHANIMAWLFSRFLPASLPVIWNIRHSLYALDDEKPLTRWVIRAHRWCRRDISAIVFNSRLSERQHTLFGIRARHTVVIPNGFDLDRWRPDAEQRVNVRRALEIPDRARVVGHVARYHPLKDQVTLLKALSIVMRNCPDSHCVLVGRQLDGENPVLKPYFAALPAHRVHVLGERLDVDKLMNAFDVFCLSSCSEAFPNVLGEAMASGVVCVATDTGDARDILGETGCIVPVGDSAALAAGLEIVLSMGDIELAQAAQAARASIVQRYGIARTVAAYRALMETEL